MGGWTLLETGNQKLWYLGLKRTDREFPKERIGARDSDLVRGYRGSHHPTPREHVQVYASFQEVPPPERSCICLLV